MAVTDYAIDGTLGVDFNRRTTTAEFDLGQTSRGSKNTIWVYVQASGAVATGTCTVNGGTFLVTDAAGTFTADTAFADGEYGWVRQTAQLAA